MLLARMAAIGLLPLFLDHFKSDSTAEGIFRFMAKSVSVARPAFASVLVLVFVASCGGRSLPDSERNGSGGNRAATMAGSTAGVGSNGNDGGGYGDAGTANRADAG